MLKLIIFDMDGLMFATEQVNYRAFTEIVKEERSEERRVGKECKRHSEEILCLLWRRCRCGRHLQKSW